MIYLNYLRVFKSVHVSPVLNKKHLNHSEYHKGLCETLQFRVQLSSFIVYK